MCYILKKMIALAFAHPKMSGGFFGSGFLFIKKVQVKLHYNHCNSLFESSFTRKINFIVWDVDEHAGFIVWQSVLNIYPIAHASKF